MRDIRGDLQERAGLLATQIGAAQDQFDKLIDQLKHEHATRLGGLKSDLHTVRVVIGIEDRRPPATNTQSELKPPSPLRPQPAQSKPDLLAPRLAAVNVR